MRLTSFTQNNL